MEYRVLDIRGKTEEEYLEAFYRLPNYRQDRVRKYRKKTDRYSGVFSFDLLLEMLSETLNCPREELIIDTDERGKPHLRNSDVEFSISHTEGFVTCAVDFSPVGIDIEAPRSVSRKLFKTLNSRELLYVLGDESIAEEATESESEIFRRFLTLWTVKEAYLKFTGEGIAALHKAEVTVKEGHFGIENSRVTVTSECKKEYVLAIVEAGSN